MNKCLLQPSGFRFRFMPLVNFTKSALTIFGKYASWYVDFWLEAKMSITQRQREVYDYLHRFSNAHGQAPTIAEIQKQFKLSSPATVHGFLSALEREGLIRRIPNVARAIEIIAADPSANECEIPLLGVIAAGRPIEAGLSNETGC